MIKLKKYLQQWENYQMTANKPFLIKQPTLWGGKKVYFLVELKCGQQKIWTTSKIKDKKAFSSRSSSCTLLRDA